MRLLLAATLALSTTAHAQVPSATSGPRPVVLELFTSQGCSSCPPADSLVAELARRPGLLALTFHVTYWNRLGWVDPFSLPEATERQRRYAAIGLAETPYTPELVVDGRRDVIGSDAPAVAAAIRATQATPAEGVRVSLARSAEGLLADVDAGHGAGTLLLIGYDREHLTPVARGENAGRTLREANVVRSIASLGAWTGRPMRLRAAIPVGDEAALLLQAADGRILGAAEAR